MADKKLQLSKDPYKGTRDFYPRDMFIQKYMFGKMREVVEKFGYEEYDSSLLEETALYAAKTGEEIVKEQTYSFTDRGGREVTIRPEMTPTLARMVAGRRMELPYPLRWYSIPNLWRYEKPQRGRLREHWQLNVDMVGVSSVDADVEMITIASEIMLTLGAKRDTFQVKVNNRKLMNAFLKDVLQLSEEVSYKLCKLIDRMNKIEPAEFESEAEKLVGSMMDMFIGFCRATKLTDLEIILPKAFFEENVGIKELTELLIALETNGVQNAVFDPTLMRGFDYYTGTVFELFDIHPDNRRSLFGGGRYDGLVGLFGVEEAPAVGFGMGDVTMRDYLETYGLLPEYRGTAGIFLCSVTPQDRMATQTLALALRSEGVNVYVDLLDRKFDNRIKAADKLGIPCFLALGADEIASGKVKVRILAERREEEVSLEDLAQFLKK